MAALLQPPEAFKLNTASNISSTWKQFKQAWSLYEIALGVQDKEENVESPPSYMLLGRMLWIDTTASYGKKMKANISFKQLLQNSIKTALRRPTLSLNDANFSKENKKRVKLVINS